MTDKELLELAAKASGIDLKFEVLQWSRGTEYPCYQDDNSVSECASHVPVIRWNPLDDDGDALRLAVKLGLVVDCSRPSAGEPFKQHTFWLDELMGNAELTRRAIVRAAAEIGKEKSHA